MLKVPVLRASHPRMHLRHQMLQMWRRSTPSPPVMLCQLWGYITSHNRLDLPKTPSSPQLYSHNHPTAAPSLHHDHHPPSRTSAQGASASGIPPTIAPQASNAPDVEEEDTEPSSNAVSTVGIHHIPQQTGPAQDAQQPTTL
ncbi:hypothetical protein J437_LFUL017010 [Ladona fulva]|uniref:Uncharacterized protein n=1 Tax=Ladona fulva TaxID=123851 RepID=A0A8K0KRT9_LADFU|nr:hypothetical protein J437_LFUL017010 [Ladona fulva]